MSTFFTAAIVIAGTIALVWMLIIINKKNNRNKTALLLNAFKSQAAMQGLIISGQEILHDHIIGIDGRQQQLLVYHYNSDPAFTNISLDEIKECTVLKEFETVTYGSVKNAVEELELRYISLQFKYKQKAIDLLVPFYNSRAHSIYEKAAWEEKAQQWQLLLSKMLKQPLKTTA